MQGSRRVVSLTSSRSQSKWALRTQILGQQLKALYHFLEAESLASRRSRGQMAILAGERDSEHRIILAAFSLLQFALLCSSHLEGQVL